MLSFEALRRDCMRSENFNGNLERLQLFKEYFFFSVLLLGLLSVVSDYSVYVMHMGTNQLSL